MKTTELRDEYGAQTTGYRPLLTNYAIWLEKKFIAHLAKSKEEAEERYEKALAHTGSPGLPASVLCMQKCRIASFGKEEG